MGRRAVLIAIFCLLLLGGRLDWRAFSQGPRGRYPAMERAALAEPFRGITADGVVREGLFTIRHTGVSTEPVRAAATAFLAALSDEQRAAAQFAVDDIEWRKWSNVDFYKRAGAGFLDMNQQQREAAFGLLRASLSARGMKLSRDIMLLDERLAEVMKDPHRFGRWRYWMTVMGEPSATEPWGWQIDGHHLVINYFVLGDQVVMTPTFMGAEPVTTQVGKAAGTTVLQEEQNKGLALVNALNDAQRKKAIIDTRKVRNNNMAEALRDNLVLGYAGVPAAEMSAPQRDMLLDVIGQFVGNMKADRAKIRMDEVRRYLHETWFAWIGDTGPDSVFYYRIHGPVILIEYDHQRPVFLPGRVPSRLHVHTVVRTPNGNDYGKDLLRQHYARDHRPRPEA